jgi:RNA-binding protein 26
LDDFLRESKQELELSEYRKLIFLDTVRFVGELFDAIHSKSYVPGYVLPPVEQTSPILSIPTGAANAFTPSGPRNNNFPTGFQNRKRNYNEVQEMQAVHDLHYGHGDRHTKHVRRGGLGYGRGNHSTGNGGFDPQNSLPAIFSGNGVNMTGPSTSSLPFNPNDAMAAVMAMQAMGIQLPTDISGAQNNDGQIIGPGKNRIDARCKDYDTKGYCLRGIACPFNHGGNSVVVPGQSQGKLFIYLEVRSNSFRIRPKNSYTYR